MKSNKTSEAQSVFPVLDSATSSYIILIRKMLQMLVFISFVIILSFVKTKNLHGNNSVVGSSNTLLLFPRLELSQFGFMSASAFCCNI